MYVCIMKDFNILSQTIIIIINYNNNNVLLGELPRKRHIN